MEEYNRFKAPKTQREMKKNLKEAVLKVQNRIVGKMSKEEKEKNEARRKAGIATQGGAIDSTKTGRDTREANDKLGDDIVDAGGKKGDSAFE